MNLSILEGNPEINQPQTFAVPQPIKSPLVAAAPSNNDLIDTVQDVSKEELKRQERLEKAQKKKQEIQVRG
jgi:hypothetical protein